MAVLPKRHSASSLTQFGRELPARTISLASVQLLKRRKDKVPCLPLPKQRGSAVSSPRRKTDKESSGGGSGGSFGGLCSLIMDERVFLWLPQGQANLRDAVAGHLAFTDPKSGKRYSLGSHLATLKARPRRKGIPRLLDCCVLK